MSARFERRRRLLAGAALAAAAAMLPLRVAAQDANTTAVQNAARDWLALIDRDDASASWNTAGTKFRSAIALKEWTGALQGIRAPLGKVTGRAVDSTRFGKPSDAAPDGEYAVVVFRTEFASRPLAHETVTLEREDGVWRVIGYVIA
jgi:hypothetical protein